MHARILRLREVVVRTGLPRSTIYDLIKKGRFPKQVQLTARCVGWPEDDIHDWVVEKLESQKAVIHV